MLPTARSVAKAIEAEKLEAAKKAEVAAEAEAKRKAAERKKKERPKKYYAVAAGRTRGIFTDWDEVEASVDFAVFHVVFHCCSSYCHACHVLCLWLVFLLVPSFVKLVMDLDSIAFCCEQMCCLRRVCQFYFKLFVLLISIFVFGVVGVVAVIVSWLL